MSTDVDALLELAIGAARSAGDAITNVRDRSLTNGQRGYRTRADLVADRTISDVLRGHPEGSAIISEEADAPDLPCSCLWIVDPLDGTWNYHHGGSKWSVSIAYVQDGEMMVGVVHSPMLRETYHYCKGRVGSYLNSVRIEPSGSRFPGEWTLTAGAPSSQKARFAPYLESLSMDMPSDDPERPVRSSIVRYGRGSMALELCHLASGRLDGLVRFGQMSWDVSGGLAVALGSGCSVESFEGGEVLTSMMADPLRPIDLIGGSDPIGLSLLRAMACGNLRM